MSPQINKAMSKQPSCQMASVVDLYLMGWKIAGQVEYEILMCNYKLDKWVWILADGLVTSSQYEEAS